MFQFDLLCMRATCTKHCDESHNYTAYPGSFLCRAAIGAFSCHVLLHIFAFEQFFAAETHFAIFFFLCVFFSHVFYQIVFFTCPVPNNLPLVVALSVHTHFGCHKLYVLFCHSSNVNLVFCSVLTTYARFFKS